MSDDVFASLVNHAWSILEQADFLLQLRNNLERAKPLWQTKGMHKQLNAHLSAGGWMQAMENRVLAARCSSMKVASFPSIRSPGALAPTPGD